MGFFKRLRTKWRVYRFFKHVGGLTPTGYCFMNYCKEITDGTESARIQSYEESFSKYAEALKHVTTDRMEVAKLVYSLLNTVYKNYGINN